MSSMNMDRAQILRTAIDRALKGEPIHDVVGALQMVMVDVLLDPPGMDEAMMLSAFDAVASDVRNIIAERFTARRSAH